MDGPDPPSSLVAVETGSDAWVTGSSQGCLPTPVLCSPHVSQHPPETRGGCPVPADRAGVRVLGVHAVEDQRMDVQVEVERRAEALHHGDADALAVGQPRALPQPPLDLAQGDLQHASGHLRVPGQEQAPGPRDGDHPLPHGHARDQLVDPARRPEILPRAVAELPWGHNALLLEKLPDVASRLGYAERAVERGWSRTMLTSTVSTSHSHRIHDPYGGAGGAW